MPYIMAFDVFDDDLKWEVIVRFADICWFFLSLLYTKVNVFSWTSNWDDV
jgi:hypothetical protein